jgi:hypothetical protein
VPPVPTQAVHGAADRRSRTLDAGTEAEQRAQIAYRKAALGAKHGAISGTLVWGEHLIGCLEGTDEGIAACRASKKCGYCGAYFLPKHGKQKFCSNAHRQRHHHDKGPMERPVFMCDEIFEIPKAPVAIPVPVPSHDMLCKSRCKAVGHYICTCVMSFEDAVTIKRRFGATNHPIHSKYEGGQAMAA